MVTPLPRATAASLIDEMELSDEEIGLRKALLEFGETDAERLRALRQLAQGYTDEVVEDLYRHFDAFAPTRAATRDPAAVEEAKRTQKEYFFRLTEGNYDAGYVEDRLRIGAELERAGLDVKWYLGAFNYYIRAVGARIFEAYKDDREQALAIFFALQKLVFLDIGLALETYIKRRERTIRVQQEAIRELSTPVLQLREGLLILPIIGVIDALRARQLTEQLLHAIRDNRAKVVVVDITGVPTIDSAVANHLIQTVDAARLMGATVIVSGLSPEIAQTLVRIGAELGRLRTVGDLQSGIDEADRIIGYRVIRTAPADTPDPHDLG